MLPPVRWSRAHARATAGANMDMHPEASYSQDLSHQVERPPCRTPDLPVAAQRRSEPGKRWAPALEHFESPI
eukprot:390148-Amphidinium_carterae.1